MRINAKDLRGKRITPLWEAVPLPAPWTVFIDVTNVCNFRCCFCPTGSPEMWQGTARKQGHMSLDTYRLVIEDLANMPKLRMLNLYKDGEPLAHPAFCEMVNMAYDAQVSDRIWTKTNGVLLDRHPNLATCGLDMLGISVPHVTSEGIKRVTGAKVDYKRYVESIRKLYQGMRTFEISIKISDVGLTDSEKDKFYSDFEGICEYITIEGLHGWSASDIKNLQVHDSGTFDGNPFDEKLCCPLLFYMLTVNQDGSVSVCNDDWGYYHALGNVNQEHLRDIWIGERYNAFRRMHLEGRRGENRACANCQYLAALPDNIDAHIEEMRGKF